ncbi:unnamed protein product, partial [Dovyalis caffra]
MGIFSLIEYLLGNVGPFAKEIVEQLELSFKDTTYITELIGNLVIKWFLVGKLNVEASRVHLKDIPIAYNLSEIKRPHNQLIQKILQNMILCRMDKHHLTMHICSQKIIVVEKELD